MSDLFYDSLEEDAAEESDGDETGGWNSLDSDGENYGNESPETEEKNNFTWNGKCCRTSREMKARQVPPTKGNNPLTDVGSNSRGKGFRTVSIDQEILGKQGLQLNEDGSFSKTPRSELEELPFVTREYRNLQFQKRKTYEIPKKTTAGRKNEKTKKSGNELIGKSGENFPGSETAEKKISKDSSYFGRFNKLTPKGLTNNNLTDAMKEILLQKHNENSPKRRVDGADHLKSEPPKNAILFSRATSEKQMISGEKQTTPGERRRISKVNSMTKLPVLVSENKYLKSVGRVKNSTTEKNKENHADGGNEPEGKSLGSNVFRNRSDILLNKSAKQQMSYAERRQKEIGFNPLCLRYNFPKCVSDTSRSNFGDSVSGELPEISSRAQSTGRFNGAEEEEEEEFYRNLIEKDRLARRSTRSEARLNATRLIDLSITNSCKDRTELKVPKQKHSELRNRVKLTAIDIPSEVTPSSSAFKKSCHYCTLGCSSAATKAELALKSRAYGFMVNARNVFKLKNQSARKSVRKNQSNESNVKTRDFPGGQAGTSFDESKRKSTTNATNESPGRAEPSKPKSGDSETGNGFLLPRFPRPNGKEGEFAAEILQQMRYCLDQDISFQNVSQGRKEKCSKQILRT